MQMQITYGPKVENAEIVSLARAKENAKIDYTEEDDLLQLYLDGISAEIENFTGRLFLQRACVIELSKWERKIDLPVVGILDIERISYYSVGGDVIDVDPEDYKIYEYLNGKENRILFNFIDFPELDENAEFPIIITLKTGYKPENMPPEIQRAALLMFNDAEAFREDRPVNNNRSAQIVLRPWKIY